MDALELLEKDHQEAKSLFKKIEAASGQEASRLWKQLSEALTLHEKLEETHLYPQLRQDSKAHDMVLEGYEEHHVMDVLIEEIDRLKPSDEAWEPKIKVLQENTEHHIKEEEDDLFPRVRKVWDAEKRRQVGEKMAAMKDERTQKAA